MSKDAKVRLGMSRDAKVRLRMNKVDKVRLGMSKDAKVRVWQQLLDYAQVCTGTIVWQKLPNHSMTAYTK